MNNGVSLNNIHHPEGDGVEPEGLNPDSLETIEIEIPMTPEQILRSLENGYFMTHQEQAEAAQYIRQLQQAVLDEREACAKLLETQIDFKGLDSQPQFLKFALDLITGCANLIRARGNHEQD
jgi:hypothetical protein